MKIGISLDELLISKSLFVISLVFLCKLQLRLLSSIGLFYLRALHASYLDRGIGHRI